jgi:hypothetical protein
VGTAGVGVFKQKTGIDLEFKNINAGSSKVTITDDVGDNEVDVDIVEANIVHQSLSGAGTNTHAQVDTHIADTANPHATDVGNLGSGLLAELNTVITDATLDDSGSSRPPSGSAGGDLGGTYPNPTVDDGADGTAVHDNIAGEILAVALKATPVSADLLLIEDSAAANAKKRITIGSLPGGGSGAIDTANTVWVAKDGNDGTGTSDRQDLPFLTIGAAITASVSGDTIMVRPGTYAEEGLTLPSGVALRGQGGWQTTFVGFTAARTANLITLADEVSIQGLTLFVSASASFSAVAYSGGGGSNTAAMYEIRFIGDGLTGVGIGINKTGTGKIIGAEIRYDTGGIGIGMQSSSGAIALEGINYPSGAGTFATAAKVTGTGRLQLADFNVGNPSIVDTFEVGGGTLLVYGVNVFNATNIVHMTADGTFIGLYGGKMEGTVDFLLDPAVTWTGATTVQATTAHQGSYSFPPTGVNVEFELAFFQEKTTTQQASFSVLAGGVSFGFPEKGAITNIGRGQSYVGGMAVWTTDNTALPASDGATLTDVTTAASSLDASIFTFQGLPAASVGTSIIFTTLRVDAAGVALPFWGVLLKQAVATVGGSYVVEVRTAANTWVEVDFQAVAVELDARYSSDVFLRPASAENLRMGVYGGSPDPLLPDGTAWPSTTIGAIGTGRFARIRITVAPTAFPTWERLAITPSHSMFNGDGSRVAHGLAMWRKTIAAGGNVFGESGGVGNASKPVGSGGGTTGWNHSMPNSRIDNNGNAIYFQQAIPDGICTAYPIRVTMVYTMRSPGGSVTTAPVGILSLLPAQVSGVRVADVSGGLVPVARTFADTEDLTAKAALTDTQDLDGGATLPATLADKALRTEFGPFSIQGYYEGDLLFIRFEMDSEGSPAQDVEVFSMIVSAVAFSEGGAL